MGDREHHPGGQRRSSSTPVRTGHAFPRASAEAAPWSWQGARCPLPRHGVPESFQHIPRRSQLTGGEVMEHSRDRVLDSPSMVPVDPRSSSGQGQEDTPAVARVPAPTDQPCPAETLDDPGHRAGMQMHRRGEGPSTEWFRTSNDAEGQPLRPSHAQTALHSLREDSQFLVQRPEDAQKLQRFRGSRSSRFVRSSLAGGYGREHHSNFHCARRWCTKYSSKVAAFRIPPRTQPPRRARRPLPFSAQPRAQPEMRRAPFWRPISSESLWS